MGGERVGRQKCPDFSPHRYHSRGAINSYLMPLALSSSFVSIHLTFFVIHWSQERREESASWTLPGWWDWKSSMCLSCLSTVPVACWLVCSLIVLWLWAAVQETLSRSCIHHTIAVPLSLLLVLIGAFDVGRKDEENKDHYRDPSSERIPLKSLQIRLLKDTLSATILQQSMYRIVLSLN